LRELPTTPGRSLNALPLRITESGELRRIHTRAGNRGGQARQVHPSQPVSRVGPERAQPLATTGPLLAR
jgi:hypothetical protein